MSHDKRYDSLIHCQRWRKLRKLKLANNPFCEVCYQRGIIEPATEVHHITPIETYSKYEDMRRLAYDYDNLMSVCHTCHRELHKKMRDKAERKAHRESYLREQLDSYNERRFGDEEKEDRSEER